MKKAVVGIMILLLMAAVAIAATIDTVPLVPGGVRGSDKVPMGRVGVNTSYTASMDQIRTYTLTNYTGARGPAGPAGTVAVGAVSTLPAGSTATVTNVGTSSAAVLNFGIPKGADGNGAGDMLKSTYDPTGINASPFARSNHSGTQSADTITDGTINKAYTAAEKTKLSGITGTNTGDDAASIKSKLGAATNSVDGYLTATDRAAFAAKQNALTAGVDYITPAGNAATATKLATPRAINGVNFDGSASITINAVDSTARAAVGQTMYIGTTAQAINRASGAETLSGVSIDGNAGTATALASTPTTCNTGQAATGILANGNATGCFTPAGGGGSTTLSGASAYPATGDTTAITPGYFNTALAAGITAPSVTSSAADGTHYVQPYNSVAFSGTPSEGMLQTNSNGLQIYRTTPTPGWQTVGAGGGSGTVTSITASSPLTGGTITGSGTIGITQATGSASGYLSSGDWNTFNNKQSALVSGTSIKTVAGISLLGSGDIGTIPTSKGGTGATDFSFSGTAHKVASVTGVLTAGNQVTTDANGNFVTSAYAVGASGGGGSGTVGNSSNAYRLAGYSAAGTAVSDSGITYATDGTSITTAQSATAADSLGLRAQSSYGTNAVSLSVVNGAITPWSFLLPDTQPPDGCLNISGGILGSTGAACGTGSGGITAIGTSTPTSISGLLKGNGSTVSAAVSGTDYAPATSGTALLAGNGAGGFSAVAVGSGLTLSGGTLTSSGGSAFTGGTLTSKLTLMTGGTSTAPLSLPSQVDPSYPSAGDLWYNGSDGNLRFGTGSGASYAIPRATSGATDRIVSYSSNYGFKDSGISATNVNVNGGGRRTSFITSPGNGSVLDLAGTLSEHIITNYGQTSGVTNWWPLATGMTAGGYSVVFVVDTYTSTTWSFTRQASDTTTDICLNGTCGKTSISETGQPVGSRLACFNSQTGVGVFARWNCQSLSGTWQ